MNFIFKYRLDQVVNLLLLSLLMHSFVMGIISPSLYFGLLLAYISVVFPVFSYNRLKYLGIINKETSFFQISYFRILFLGWKHFFRFNFGSPRQ